MKRAEIKQRALTSLRWTGLLAAFNLLSNFLFKVMLARFLLPADFGNLSIAMATMTIAVMLASLGVPQTIVAKEGLSRHQLSAMFAMSVLAALVLAITLGILAPTFGRFFDMNQLEKLVRIVAPTIVGMCCLQLFLSLLQRELRADLVAQLQIGRNLTSILVTLVMLLMGMGVSAVLWAHLTAAWIWVLVSASILLRRGEWPFSWRMRVSQLGGKIQFGCTVWAKELTNEVAVRLDEIIIGSLLRPEILGFYYFGKSLLEALRRLVSSSFAQVTLPLFAKLSADTKALRSVYNKLTFSVAMVDLPEAESPVNHIAAPLWPWSCSRSSLVT